MVLLSLLCKTVSHSMTLQLPSLGCRWDRLARQEAYCAFSGALLAILEERSFWSMLRNVRSVMGIVEIGALSRKCIRGEMSRHPTGSIDAHPKGNVHL